MNETSTVSVRVFRAATLIDHNKSVEQAIRMMQQNLGQSIALSDLARSASMSSFHFVRVFSRVTGLSPGRFLAALRMQEAKRLLLQTTRSVTDVSLDVGYQSLGTFIRTFSHAVGYNPSDFRILAMQLRSVPIFELKQFSNSQMKNISSASIVGEVEYSEKLSIKVVAIFSEALPKSRPIACVLLQKDNNFAFYDRLQAGCHVFAAGIKLNASLEDVLLGQASQILVGSIALNPSDNRQKSITIALKPQLLTAPPLIFAFPLFIAESLIIRDI